MEEYPEHKKLEDVQKESQFLGAFLEWAETRGMYLATYDDSRLFITHKSINTLLSEYLNIDLVKLENEKKQMLDEIRKPKQLTP